MHVVIALLYYRAELKVKNKEIKRVGKHHITWTGFERITSAAVRNRQRQPRRWNTAALISSQIRCNGTRTRRRSTARAGLLLPAPWSSETSLAKTGHSPGFNERGGARRTTTVTALHLNGLWIKKRAKDIPLRQCSMRTGSARKIPKAM